MRRARNTETASRSEVLARRPRWRRPLASVLGRAAKARSCVSEMRRLAVASGGARGIARASGRRRGYHRAAGTLLDATIVLLLVSALCCDRKTTPSARRPVNAAYLELVSLSRSPDATHEVRVQGPDGAAWYRDKVPGFDLSQCAFERTIVDQDSDGTWGIVVPVRTDVDGLLLQQWSSDRLGADVGVILDGRVILVTKLQSPLRKWITVPAFATQEEAVAAAAAIRVGGLRPATTTQAGGE